MAKCLKCGKSKLIGSFKYVCHACGAQYCEKCFEIISYKEGRSKVAECMRCKALIKG